MTTHTARRTAQAGNLSSTFGDDLIVRARFIPPRPKPHLLPRPRLEALLTRLTDYPLTLLRAEAGYGKTTAIASSLARSPFPLFWYNLDDGDADPLIYLLHLIHVFRAAHPMVGERALNLLAQEEGAARLWPPAVDSLTNDLLDALPADGEVVLVLDDYGLVNRPEINAITERFIEHAPPRLHLVITTRSMPSLPSRARWRASGELLEIGRDELAFTPDEIAALFIQRTGERLAPEAAHTLAAETEGWPIAVQMVCEGVSKGLAHTLDDLLRHMPGPSELLFNYLAEEVFLRQPREVQTFLAETAILRYLDPDASNYLLSRTDSDNVLRYLEEHSLFVAQEGAYRYHHLFRDFLLRRAEVPVERRRALQGKAAAFYRQRGDYEEAIHHLLAAGDYASAADLLATIARPVAFSGRHQALAAWLDQLPDGLLDAHPELLLARGHAHRFASQYREALSLYARAQRRFELLGDAVGEVRAWRGQALVYLDTVQPARAEPLVRQALRKIGRNAREERANLLILLAENKINAGQLSQAERLHRAVYRAAGREDIPPMDPRVYVREGRFALARQIVESNLRADPWGAGQWRAPRSHREAAVLLAWIDAMTGEAESARRYAEQSLELGRTLGAPIVECVSLARLGHGWLCGPDFDLTRARTYYHDSRLIAERIGVPRFKVESLLGLTLAFGLDGKFAEAEANAREAISILEAAGDRYLTSVLYLALGAAATVCNHQDGEHWLREARRLGQACGDHFGPCAADLRLAIYLARAGRAVEAMEAFVRALAAAQAHDYDFLFTRLPLLGPKDLAARRELHSLLQVVERKSSLPVSGYAARLAPGVERFASSAPSGAAALETPAAARLYIQTLGPFRVWREGREIERTGWGREKALHLLQFLVCQRGRLVHREQILEALWPGSPPTTAGTGLRVALSALRKTLASGPGAEFIHREGESLQLDLARVDADEFTRLVQSARALEAKAASEAIRLYEAALALYHGDFLEENLYAEWTSEERERLLTDYFSAAERLARLWVSLNDYERGARWANAILAKDPLWEEAYALLMECHWKQGHRALAVRTYERCRRRLRASLGVEPSPSTAALFEAISRA